MNIRTVMDWKIFWILFMAAEISMFASLPYAVSISGDAIYGMGTSLIGLLMVQFARGTGFLILSIFTGIFLGKKVGLGTPLLESLLEGRGLPVDFGSSVKLIVFFGVFLATSLFAIDKFIFSMYTDSFISFLTAPPFWERFMYSFYAGIVEEVILRFFMVTLLVWISWKIKKTSEDLPTNMGVWVSILVVSLLYGLVHISSLSESMGFVVPAYVGIMTLDIMSGSIMGWLYWKKGIEAAILANLVASLTLYMVIGSLIHL
ncbi:CPBP family glutamic-type intramembrane protease [Methanolobus sp. ZRKC3]|uniref:CPBP family glutamic-type intramembrane protease n=1 Tax=Methanolobus sp. ZRKC3 TaxID=3125786 RepID=UPI0032565035